MKRTALASILCLMMGAPLSAQVPELFRVRTGSSWTVGSFEPVGPDSFRITPRRSGARVLGRNEIVAVQRNDGFTRRPVQGAVVGAALGAAATSNFVGPVVYGGAVGAFLLLVAAVGAESPDMPGYPSELYHHKVALIASSAAVGALLGMIPRAKWVEVPTFAPEVGVVTPPRRTYGKRGLQIGMAVGAVTGFLAGGGFRLEDLGTATLYAARGAGVGGVLGFIGGHAATQP